MTDQAPARISVPVEDLSAGERAFTAWAATSGADGTPLMWTWSEMPPSQQERWAKIALAAAPSADKLREVLVDLTSWFTKPVQGQNGMVWVIPSGEMGADDALNAALAALKAEGAK